MTAVPAPCRSRLISARSMTLIAQGEVDFIAPVRLAVRLSD
jgi:hypothetical protein